MIGLLLGYGPWVVFAGSLTVLFPVTRRWLPESGRALFGLGAVWVFLIQGDSVLLGSRARLEWGDGEMLFLGYAYIALAYYITFNWSPYR